VSSALERARRVLEVEAEAIRRAGEKLGREFLDAVSMILENRGRVIWSGMGKSGIICRKLAATMSSTGTPALFLHPAEAIHGDLGMVGESDLVIAMSNTGETGEILRLVEYLKRRGVPLIGMSSRVDSSLARLADVHIDLAVDREACPLGLAPTASTTVSLALGDALCMEVAHRKGFSEEDFARLHPGGGLGKKFLRVRELMHRDEELPLVSPDTPLKDVIYEMSRKGLGLAVVADPEGQLLGVVTDGDLRRLMESDPDPLERIASEVMHPGGVTIAGNELATAALRRLEEKRITSLIVVGNKLEILGVLHLHDLWGVGLF